MKIFYQSDLHLEFSKNKFYYESLISNINSNPIEDILVLAGDIHYLSHSGSSTFKILKSKFKDIYYVCGNHEFYDGKKNANILLKSFKNSYDNFHIVNNHKIELNENTIILFSTMFTQINQFDYIRIKDLMNDFHVIKFNDKTFYPSDYNTIFNKSFEFLKQEIENNKDKNIIVVSHHVPTFKDNIKEE
jgi:predicted MPP superfamily phosphohydrolase